MTDTVNRGDVTDTANRGDVTALSAAGEPSARPVAAVAAAAVRRLLEAVGELEEGLASETRALIDGDVGGLLAAVEGKRRALVRIERELRDAETAAAGTGSGGAELQRLLERSPEWPSLLERLGRCQALNQAAGGAIAASRRGTDELLCALGHAPQAGTYGVDGNAAAVRTGRGIGVC